MTNKNRRGPQRKKTIKKNNIKNKSVKYICYTGIGSNKTGTHTEEDFLKRMNKDKKKFNTPKNIKTLDQWIKFSGAYHGKCKTDKRTFKISGKKRRKICKMVCDKEKKEFYKKMKKVRKMFNLNQKQFDNTMKLFSKNCEDKCMKINSM
jgi:hypothetical protein